MEKNINERCITIGEYKFEPISDVLIDNYKNLIPYQTKNMCDYSIGSLLMWWDFYDMLLLNSKEIFMGYSPKEELFVYPFGKEKDMISIIRDLKSAKKGTLSFLALSKDEVAHLSQFFPDMEVVTNRDWYDYIYDLEKMITLSGKKYHSKRNYVSRFKKLYENHCYKDISCYSLDELMDFIKRTNSVLEQTKSLQHETQSVRKLIENGEKYNQKGGVLSVDGKIVAITIGELVNDTVIVHIEKADRDYEGAYPTIANYFAKEFENKAKFINREDDMGILGLRKAKLDYHPLELLEKYKVVIK